jgi:L-ribulose-5-phosphate 3-epimerase
MNAYDSNLEAIPLGIYEKALPRQMTWPERLTTAKAIGFQFVEISIDDSDARIARLEWDTKKRGELRRAIVDSGMPIKSISLSAHRRYPLGNDSPENRRMGLDIFKKAIDFAVDIGIRFILVAGADVYHDKSNADTEKRFLEGLEKGFEMASGAGVMLALENWDVGVDSIAKAMTYVNHFHSPWFQLYADIGNLAYAGYNVTEELELGKDHIAAVHVKDTLPGHVRYVPPGEGVVPFVDSFAKLAEIGFQGPVALELWTEEQPDAVDQVTHAYAWIREKMAAGWQTYNDVQTA